MTVCPVCEHAQPHGRECEVCGKPLAAGPAGAPEAGAMEGLEPTLQPAVPAAGAAPVPGLEPTGHAAVEAFPDVTPDLEQTRAAPVDVDVAPAPDIERVADGLPADAPTAAPAFVVCRYCRTTAVPGERICARCGMRLPTFEGGAAEAAPAARRCGCGALVTRSLCPSCGARR